jgi:uncharacterized membrane protein affecting hemolysin expression
MEAPFMIVVIALIVLALFVLLREFWLWYWKVNNQLNHQRKQSEYLRILIELMLEQQPESERKQELFNYIDRERMAK